MRQFFCGVLVGVVLGSPRFFLVARAEFARHPRRSRSFRFAVCAEFGKVDILVNSPGITRRTPILRHKRQRLECDAGDQPEGHTSVRILDAT
jgi:hypothetical protein